MNKRKFLNKYISSVEYVNFKNGETTCYLTTCETNEFNITLVVDVNQYDTRFKFTTSFEIIANEVVIISIKNLDYAEINQFQSQLYKCIDKENLSNETIIGLNYILLMLKEINENTIGLCATNEFLSVC